MSTFKIPNSQGLTRAFPNSDKYGELWETFGIDLSSTGKIKTAKKLVKVKDTSDDVNFGYIVALSTYNSHHYAVTAEGTGFEMYRCSVTNDVTDEQNWDKLNSAGNFDQSSDAVVFGGFLLVSQATDILSYNGTVDDNDWWTAVTSGTALTSARPHMMAVLRGGQETLFVTDDNKVRYYNSTAGHSTVTLQTDLVACTLDSTGEAMWVGTFTESNESALVYEIYVGEEIDTTPVARHAYKVDGRAVLSLRVIDGIPTVLTDRGHIQQFDGAGFKTVTSFPFAFTSEQLDGIRAGAIENNSLSRPVHPKGTDVHNSSWFILLNSEMYNEAKIPSRTSSGIWEFDSKTGVLNHRAAIVEETSDDAYHIFEQSGPLMVLNNSESFFLAGCTLHGKTNGLFVETTGKYGYITTVQIESGTVQDSFESAYLKAKTLTGSDSIELKYRIIERDDYMGSGTWFSDSIFNIAEVVDVEEGDEVTFLEGVNAGKITHVTHVDTSDTVTSITVDSPIGTATQSALIRITNFKELTDGGTYTSDDGEFKRFGIGDTNTWVQYKMILDGDVSIREFISKSNSKNEL